MKTLLFSLSLLIGLTSCFKRIDSTSGPVTTETRNISSFNSIAVYGSINVFIVSDTNFQIKVEAGERLMEYVQTAVINNQLEIKVLNNPIANYRPVNVFVNADSLQSIQLEGSGNITSNMAMVLGQQISIYLKGSGNISLPISSNSLLSSLIGSGTITVSGNTYVNQIAVEGSGKFKAKNLISHTSNVLIEGSGEAIVNVTDSLTATVIGSGRIEYYGSPNYVNPSVTGSGSIVPR